MRISKPMLINLLFLVIGGIALVTALNYRIGTASRMGPGFFPILVSGSLILIGLFGFLGAMLRPSPSDLLPPFNLRPLIIILLAVTAFGLLVQSFGVLPALVALIVIGRFAGDRPSLLELATLTIIISAAGLGIFKYALGINLHILV